jgi:hypothetical protein
MKVKPRNSRGDRGAKNPVMLVGGLVSGAGMGAGSKLEMVLLSL